mmetsp:Transcript_36307/g.79024  ORF Transcript_36307/g.79024 Transcript_36307/m.79024 type:complete len:111 (-) Transcript_36307:2001-2333(-)
MYRRSPLRRTTTPPNVLKFGTAAIIDTPYGSRRGSLLTGGSTCRRYMASHRSPNMPAGWRTSPLREAWLARMARSRGARRGRESGGYRDTAPPPSGSSACQPSEVMVSTC